MKTKWLFPNRFWLIGWLVFVPSTILGLAAMYADFKIGWLTAHWLSESITITSGNSITHLMDNQDLTDEVAAIGIIAGLLLIAFSREKVEDEMIGQLRLEALQWSVYANYIILAIAILTVYDDAFFNVMIYNMFTVLLVFIIRFRWLIYRNNHILLAL
ncbi:hypothetical protein [Spirosoma radiotolerans]|uniref:Uncharacterized protein n=1 Tax=Spirosoma radiotolerans TaxID=1379870 RepID=A0A0E4A086_9BACT|nr:hypothetical protein [Spirosoma radiotolerans]AKD58335.1 hypothetical protein SD10_04880 [Spirosoma radiotolerans]